MAITKFWSTFVEKGHFYCLYAGRGVYLFHITCHIICSIFFHNGKKKYNMKTTQDQIKHHVQPKKKKKRRRYHWRNPCRLLDQPWAAEQGFSRRQMPVEAAGDGLSCHKPASRQAVLLPCRWTEGPHNDNRKTHLSSEKVTNELIHAAYKLFTTTLTPLKTNSKVNFKYRDPEPPVLSPSACKTFCNRTDVSLASAPLLNWLGHLGLLFYYL